MAQLLFVEDMRIIYEGFWQHLSFRATKNKSSGTVISFQRKRNNDQKPNEIFCIFNVSLLHRISPRRSTKKRLKYSTNNKFFGAETKLKCNFGAGVRRSTKSLTSNNNNDLG